MPAFAKLRGKGPGIIANNFYASSVATSEENGEYRIRDQWDIVRVGKNASTSAANEAFPAQLTNLTD